MRFMMLLATTGLAAGHAVAQDSSWDGAYVGVSVGIGGLSPDTSVSIDVERAGRPDATYTGATYNPRGGVSSFDSEISSESTGAFVVIAGVSFDQGDLVWGVETKLEAAPIERNYAVGPVRFNPAGGLGSGATFPQPPGGGVPVGTLIYIPEERETITSNLQIDYNLAFRGKLGFAVADTFLLSGTAGVAVATASLDVRQDSEQDGAWIFQPPRGTPFGGSFPTTSTFNTVSASETLVGLTVGALAEYRITDDWIGRADATYTKYGEISATNSIGSSVSIEPSTWSVSLGVARKF